MRPSDAVKMTTFASEVFPASMSRSLKKNFFPQDFCVLAFHTVDGDDFLVFLVTINNVVVGEFQRLVHESRDD